jgi:hypothetical protein
MEQRLYKQGIEVRTERPAGLRQQEALEGDITAGSMSAADKAKLDAITGVNTGDQFTAVTSSRFLGRVTAGFGAAEELTATQAKALLAVEIADVSGLQTALDSKALLPVASTSVTFTPSGTGTVARTAASKLRDVLSAKDFGAVGDGSTNDDAALTAAFQSAADTGKPLFIPAGTYMVDRGVGALTSMPSGRFVVHGDGAATVIKMNDGGITSDFAKIFSFQPTTDMEFIEIGNLVLDMNARGSPPPASDFDYQHSHAIAVEPPAGISIAHCRFPGLIIKDPAADGINISPSSTGSIDSVQINDFLEIDRTRVRSSIECSRLPNSLVVTGAKCHRIESEPVSVSTTPKKILLANCDIEILDIGEDTTAVPTLVELHMVNVTTTSGTALANVRVVASNCTLRQDGGILYYLYKSTFTGCTFLHAYDSAANSISPLNVFWRSANADVSVDFNACRFVIDSDNDAIAPTGYLVNPSHVTTAANIAKFRATFNNCRFDKRAQGSVSCQRNGTWQLNDCTFGGTLAAISYGVTAGNGIDVTVNGGNFSAVTGASVRGTWTVVDQSTSIAWLRMSGDWIGVTTPVATSTGATAGADNQLVNTRVMPMAATPAGGLKGDVIEIPPTDGKPDQYRCVTSSASAATFRMTRQAGVTKGTTANRPALTTKDTGARYLDTTLAAGGKPIVWTGTAWVDSLGATV